jgi:hypothetical protein
MDRISRLEVLRQLERGEITLDECNRLLALEAGLSKPVMSMPAPAAPPEMPAPVPPVQPSAEAFVESQQVEPAPPAEDLQRYRSWRWVWLVPFGLGLLLMLLATNWMLMGFQAAGLGWGFWLSFFPFALGVLIMVLGMCAFIKNQGLDRRKFPSACRCHLERLPGSCARLADAFLI